MPIYEYRCPSCGKDFDEIKGFADSDKPSKCPNCGAMAYREIADVGAVIYKGSGFYCKDSASCSCPCSKGGER